MGVWFLRVQPAPLCPLQFLLSMLVFWPIGEIGSGGLSKAQGRRWGIMSLVVIPFLFVIGFLGGGLENPEQFNEFLTGGLHWQSFAYAAWESFLMIGIIVFLLYFFPGKTQSGWIDRYIDGRQCYLPVYIIHLTILVALQILLLPIGIPTILKFFLVSLIAVPVCFLLSILIRKIPYARRVLG